MNPMKSYMVEKTARKLSEALQLMHENYLRDGIIHDPLEYHMNQGELHHALRNLCYHNILIQIGESAYLWAGGADPDYKKLAFKVIDN